MKSRMLLFFLASGLIFSCSNDKNNDLDAEQNSIIGEWQASELQINNETASDNAKFSKQVLDFLTERDCFILTFNFKADLTVTIENYSDYLDITRSPLTVNCPTKSNTNTSTYTYDGSVLTTIDENGQTLMVDVTINGDTMSVNASDLNLENFVDNFNDQGQLIFKRK